MKKISALCLALLLALSLCACGGSADTESLGKYNCTSISMQDMTLEGSGQWLELQEGGKATLFVSDQTYTGEYTLADGAFTLNIDGQDAAAGTLEGDTLTIDLLGATLTFVKEAEAEQ